MVTTGYPQEKANALVNRISIELGLEEAPIPDAKEEDTEEAKAKVDNPVDRYIW